MKYLNLIIIFSICALFGNTVVAKDSDINATTKVVFSSDMPTSGNLILAIYKGDELGLYGERLDKVTNGGLRHILKASDFKAGSSDTKVVPAPQGSGFDQILLVGLDDKTKPLSAVALQNLAGSALQKAIETFKTAPPMLVDTTAENGAFVALGAKLGSYYFDKYQTADDKQKTQKEITLITPDSAATEKVYKTQLDSVAKAIFYARNISNEPANVIYPQSFVDRWRTHFKGISNIKIRVLDEKDMLKMNMGAIYGVGRGSKRPPRIMIVEYTGADRSQKPVAIVGKGITFDTGGISLKNPTNMWDMKFDMSGAASAIGSVYALAGRQAKVNVVGIAALAENMPGGNAQRPGDVVTSMSGKTIQIRSTDAEGRLVLADAVHYADVTYNPPLLVDLATLTGSAARALGKDYAALFTRHDELVGKMLESGINSGDELWHLPLNDKHFKAISNEVADVMNSGPTAPGASAGAAFVGTFIRDTTPWVHLDIAGVAYNDKATPIKASPGSTSFGIRLMNAYLKAHFEK